MTVAALVPWRLVLSFHLHTPATEQAYLAGLPLSAEAKVRVHEFMKRSIADVSDEVRCNPQNRPHPDKLYFMVQYVFLDRWGDSRMHALDFYIRDDKAPFGVLLLVFIEFQ